MKLRLGILVLVVAWLAWWLIPGLTADGFASWGWPRFIMEGAGFALLAFLGFRWWEHCDA